MGLYEGIKDVAKVVQQADNIELYRQLLDLSAQAIDGATEKERLKSILQYVLFSRHRVRKRIYQHVFMTLIVPCGFWKNGLDLANFCVCTVFMQNEIRSLRHCYPKEF